jgi:hypothetical protein
LRRWDADFSASDREVEKREPTEDRRRILHSPPKPQFHGRAGWSLLEVAGAIDSGSGPRPGWSADALYDLR